MERTFIVKVDVLAVNRKDLGSISFPSFLSLRISSRGKILNFILVTFLPFTHQY